MASSPIQSSECHHMLRYSSLCNDRLHHETSSFCFPRRLCVLPASRSPPSPIPTVHGPLQTHRRLHQVDAQVPAQNLGVLWLQERNLCALSNALPLPRPSMLAAREEVEYLVLWMLCFLILVLILSTSTFFLSMLIPNCLFRVGGAAILLSNRYRDRRRAKYGLVHVMRTHRGADEKAFSCVYQKQDDVGKMGVSLSKDLMEIVGKDAQNFWRAVEGFREGWGCHLDASRENFFFSLHRLVFNIAFLFSLVFFKKKKINSIV
ncbi:unnamed protein product, partial [Vitis vinifera]|uniref:FAE domain-containing protein n=1 Tax=Vitis vinifera TaxID=29760 RepID=D7UAW4_VITVI